VEERGENRYVTRAHKRTHIHLYYFYQLSVTNPYFINRFGRQVQIKRRRETSARVRGMCMRAL